MSGMGDYDANRRGEAPFGREMRADAGEAAVGRLSDKFSALVVAGGPPSKDLQLLQVMKAVEDAEVIINKQMEEKDLLRDELRRKTQELEQYKLGGISLRSSADFVSGERNSGSYTTPFSNSPSTKEREKVQWADNGSSLDPNGTLIVHQNGSQEGEDPFQPGIESNPPTKNNGISGNLRGLSGVQDNINDTGPSQFHVPSSGSLSPGRQQKLAEYDSRHGVLPGPHINSNMLWKQELVIKVREHEDEIIQLRKHLVDYSVKETQIRNEKYVLEKRIAYMRLSFDQQQQDLVDAASKALSYRQDIIEENIRLTYALQSAQQEKTTFVSSLLPLLSEYSLQPVVLDAHSIVSNLKILFKHLQEKLIFTEEKLKESRYQLAPWNMDTANTNFSPQSPSHPLKDTFDNTNKNNLELVAQTPYSHIHSPISSPSNVPMRNDFEPTSNQVHPASPMVVTAKIPEHEIAERIAPSASRTSVAYETPLQVNHAEHHVSRSGADSRNQIAPSKNSVGGNIIDDPEVYTAQHAREHPSPWGGGSSSYMQSTHDGANVSYPYLPPVKEEPGSSFSEAGEEDHLPAIDGLQISGDAFPGGELSAAGYSINGTTSCNFEWVRHLEDGSVNYIDGAKQPRYLVTADDVDYYLAIEVQPLDNRKRKGELVKVFSNEQRKIVCDPEMQEQIERAYTVGHVSFEVFLSAGALDIWERANLAIKREGYSIKCSGPRGIVVTEKFLPITNITIPYGYPFEFMIHCADDAKYLLRATDANSSRDTIVLTMRLFKMRAVEKKKGRKRGIFF